MEFPRHISGFEMHHRSSVRTEQRLRQAAMRAMTDRLIAHRRERIPVL